MANRPTRICRNDDPEHIGPPLCQRVNVNPDRAEHTAKRISMVRIRVGADGDRKTTPLTGDNRHNATPDD